MKTNEIWFKRKKYGWGWRPANAKGWLVMIAYTAAVSAYPLFTESQRIEMSAPLFLTITALFTVVVIRICSIKGETPGWRWGSEDD